MNALCVVSGIRLDYSQKDISLFRKHMLLSILNERVHETWRSGSFPVLPTGVQVVRDEDQDIEVTPEEFGDAPGESGGILRFVLGSLRGFVSGFSTRFAGWFRCGRKRAREGRGLKNLRPKKMRRRGSFGDIDGSSNNRRSSSSSRVNFDMVGLVCNDDTK